MTDRILAIVQARSSSTRLPGKVLRAMAGRPMLARQIERLRRCRLVDRLAVATSAEASDDAIAALCAGIGLPCYRGSLDDVLGRFHGAAVALGPAEHVVRLTGDCPLSDPQIVDACVALHLANGADYTSNSVERTYPDGLDVEVMRFETLDAAFREASERYEREHVTPFVYRHPERFSLDALRHVRDLADMRWTVDTAEDFEFVEQVFARLTADKPDFGWRDILAAVESGALPDRRA